MLNISYVKNRNNDVLKELELEEYTNIKNVQRYIPIYNRFFELNNTNYNNIMFDQNYYLTKFIEKDASTINTYKVNVVDKDENEKKTVMFCKFSPLIDPVKYMMGKYENININTMPNIMNNEGVHEKLLNENNCAYIDGLFTYFSSKLLNINFQHAIEYYGSFLGNKQNYYYNVSDDLEYISNSSYFYDNLNKLYKIENPGYEDEAINHSCKNKKSLKISDDNTSDLMFETLDNNTTNVFTNLYKTDNDQQSEELVEWTIKVPDDDAISINSDNSECSSRSSDTDNSEAPELLDEEDVSDNESDMESDDCTSEEELTALIYNYPVQVICMEKCKDTLDNYMNIKDIKCEEWRSIMFQVIITLCSYQKLFSFTHNDLHTNNIMYIETKEKYLYYKYNNIYYKVPTFGKIYKIIDFGRSIYKYKNVVFCSDSFNKGEDADTQYNTEPFFDENKPRLDPNMSFDLCRLGCSLFDYFIDELEDQEEIFKNNEMASMICNWCLDDKGRNVLYKKNGDERYPEFKLYKMIARTVSKYVPKDVIKSNEFKKYIINENNTNKEKLMNIDVLNI